MAGAMGWAHQGGEVFPLPRLKGTAKGKGQVKVR